MVFYFLLAWLDNRDMKRKRKPNLLAAKKDLLERAGAELEYQMTKQERSGEQPEKSGKERERE